ncbi:hypothetical protein N9U28_00015 [Acidimicrobiaceae bacterium]|nr:hypothetical protein [Acidimicrobiaceae bacterium]MDA9757165.1 hypothetical protein [Acidimicrobiaceae bacterium]|tara:strand:- start:81 stop:278 length:198 start_codon:yes stop_codon:yes gene_type:complete
MNKNKNELNSDLIKNINEIESELQNLITSNSEKLDKESIEEIKEVINDTIIKLKKIKLNDNLEEE